MTRRERVLKTLNFETPDKLPKDLGGMASTSISCIALNNLIKHLNLPERPIKVYDTIQMLGLPDLDVLDALDCDVVTTNGAITNAFNQDELWKPFDFNGKVEGGAVTNPENFGILENGTITQRRMFGKELVEFEMPASAVVFNEKGAGKPLDLTGELPKRDLIAFRKEVEEYEMPDEEVNKIVEHCKKVRESTDRAVFFTGLTVALGFEGGMVEYNMLCALEPEYAHELHDLKVQLVIKKYKSYFH